MVWEAVPSLARKVSGERRRPCQVELLLDRERPHVAQGSVDGRMREGRAEVGEEVPVLDVEQDW